MTSEAQKPTTDAYRKNWQAIWGKKSNDLPDGITQQDLDEATDMPPLGDSRRLKRK